VYQEIFFTNIFKVEI